MLITTIDQFAKKIPTAVSIDSFEDLETYVESAELWLKSNVLGKSLYDNIDASQDSSSGADADLLSLCRTVIANHAYYNAIPFLDLVHTNNGFGVVKNSNVAPASKERVDKLRKQCLIRRDQEVDSLIDYLLSHSTYHDAWKSSDVFGDMFSSLLPTLKVFGKYHDISDLATLNKMRGAIITVQNTWVADVISQDYMDVLVESQKDDDFTPEDNAIINLLRDAICKLSLAWGIESMGIIIDKTGVVTMKTTDYYVGSIAEDVRLQSYKNTFIKAGKSILEKVINTMKDNIESYPVFASSKEYKVLTAEGYTNTEDDSIFSSMF